MNYELNQKIQKANEREMNDDHLTTEERSQIVSEIRLQENIDSEVSDEQIYQEYVVQ